MLHPLVIQHKAQHKTKRKGLVFVKYTHANILSTLPTVSLTYIFIVYVFTFLVHNIGFSYTIHICQSIVHSLPYDTCWQKAWSIVHLTCILKLHGGLVYPLHIMLVEQGDSFVFTKFQLSFLQWIRYGTLVKLKYFAS